MSAEVTLESERHVYRQGEKKLPGVTQILGLIDDLEGIPRDILDAAARFGRHVHIACHLHSMGRLDECSLDPALVPYVAGYKKFLRDTCAVVCESERLVHHSRLGYAGTLDFTAMWGRNGLANLVDIKSSAVVPRSVGPQTAAYREALIDQSPQRLVSKTRYCLHLKPNGDYRLHALTNYSVDWQIFLSALNIYQWNLSNGSSNVRD
ncbi:MAG: hypothetical protein ACRD3Q_20435 [Terriglobales bacterium]